MMYWSEDGGAREAQREADHEEELRHWECGTCGHERKDHDFAGCEYRSGLGWSACGCTEEKDFYP